MKLKSLHLQNYKSHKNFTADFNSLNKLIQGHKGSGKTSLKDAFTWLLTGRMVDDPTPVDEHGVLINHLKIVVSCEFEDGTTLKIEDSQKWVKDTLRSNHNATYFINDTPCIERDYQDFLDKKIGTLEQRRILLDPEYFAYGDGLKIAGKTPKTATQRRREIVIGIAGAESLETQIAENEEKSKKAKFAYSEFKKDQNDAYAGVESLNDAKVDVSHINQANILEAISQLKAQETEAIKGLESINSGNDTHNAIQRTLSDAQTALSQARSQYALKFNEHLANARKPYDEYVAKSQHLKSQLQTEQFNEQQQNNKKTVLTNAIDSLKRQHKQLGSDYKAKAAEVYIPNSTTCPTCHQGLPSEQLLSAEARFNQNKSIALENMKNDGLSLNQKIASSEKELSLLNIEYRVGELQAELNDLVEPIITHIPTFEETPEYVSLAQAITVAQQSLENNNDDATKDIYQRKINAVQVEIQQYQDQLKGFDTNNHLDIAIEKKSQELQTIAENMDAQQEILDACNEFTRKTLESLETTLEQKFDGLRFKMFEFTLDGNQKDTCITYAKTPHGYIPWESLSGGQKRSATIKLANAFAKAWDIQLPLFIDDTQIYTDDELSADMQLIRITEVPHAELGVK